MKAVRWYQAHLTQVWFQDYLEMTQKRERGLGAALEKCLRRISHQPSEVQAHPKGFILEIVWYSHNYHPSDQHLRTMAPFEWDAEMLAGWPFFPILQSLCAVNALCTRFGWRFGPDLWGEFGKGPIWLYCWSSMEEGHKPPTRTLSSEGCKPMKHPFALLGSRAVLLVYLSLLIYRLVVHTKYFCSYCTYAHLGETVAEETQAKCFAAPKACKNKVPFPAEKFRPSSGWNGVFLTLLCSFVTQGNLYKENWLAVEKHKLEELAGGEASECVRAREEVQTFRSSAAGDKSPGTFNSHFLLLPISRGASSSASYHCRNNRDKASKTNKCFVAGIDNNFTSWILKYQSSRKGYIIMGLWSSIKVCFINVVATISNAKIEW